MLRTGASVASDLDDTSGLDVAPDHDDSSAIGEVFLEAWHAMLDAGLTQTGRTGTRF